jgi:C1A family cysteine protease
MPAYAMGLRKDAPDVRDRHFRTSWLQVGKLRQRFMAALLPASMDLRRELNVEVFDQGSLGSCASQAAATVLGHLLADQGEVPQVFSRLFLYGNARGWTEDDSGSTLRDVWKGVSRHGVPYEALWPYDTRRWTERPPQPVWDAAIHRAEGFQYFRLDTIQGMKLCLSEGVPFIFGIGVYPSFMETGPLTGYTVRVPDPRERLEGGHALTALGYDDDKLNPQTGKRGAFLFRNSWGAAWPDVTPEGSGHAWLPYELAQNTDFFWDAWTARSIAP